MNLVLISQKEMENAVFDVRAADGPPVDPKRGKFWLILASAAVDLFLKG